jgi:D-glycero-D-manno-heptose 1,7-bisphosphate phosphatase
VDLANVPMVADTARDLLAAQAAGCEPHLVLSGRAEHLGPEQVQALLNQVPAARAHASLGAFADFLLQRDNIPDSSAGSLA